MQLLEIADLSTAELLSTHFTGIKRGIEKESLRIRCDGHLSQKPHPQALGSALTNPHITTDYSEALPELITAASSDRQQPLRELTQIHQFIYQHLDDEYLWAMSMPCVMEAESQIPIAHYGSSNAAKMKEIYRVGLGHRYGRLMQTIAGVHYNFSLPQAFWQAFHQQQNSSMSLQEFISDKYMGLIRNYLRFSWLIPLFYGASPALCESFFQNRAIDLEELVPGTRYDRYATSLRMSDLGYQNKAQSRLDVSYNSLAGYIDGLESAISTVDPLYQKIGIVEQGQYRQLNANILQIENEFYSSIRPKRVSTSGERPSKALRNGGVEYVEIRALDLNPFSPIGIDQSQIAFLDAFLLACVFAPSPDINQRETGEYQENFRAVVRKGRHPGLCLALENRCIPTAEAAHNLLGQILPFADMLDSVYETAEHANEISALQKQLANFDTTLSGKIIADIKQRNDGFFPYAMEISQNHKKHFEGLKLAPEVLAGFERAAAKSHQRQAQIESDDRISFEAFLANYYE